MNQRASNIEEKHFATPPSSAKLFFTFLRIGTFTIGGGYAMLSLVHHDTVEKHHWIKEEEFWDMITVVQTLPGVFAINTALYVGLKVSGKKGSMMACLGAILPSILIILSIVLFFSAYWNNPVVERVFKGIRPCVVALILAPTIDLIKATKLTKKTIWIPLASLGCISFLKISPIWIILICGFLGALIAVYKHKKKTKKEEEE